MNTSLRPLVRLHYAQSLDGRIGWMGLETRLSSREGLLLAQRERSASDAVLVGSGTLRIDDPRLTVREYQGRQPRRVVLSRDLNVPSTAKIFGPGGAVVIIGREDLAPLHERERLEALGADVCLVPADQDGMLSLPAVLQALHARGVERLMVEGGAKVLTSFLRQRLADEATIEIAPQLFGAQGLCALGCVKENPTHPTPRLWPVTVERAGESVLVRGPIVYS